MIRNTQPIPSAARGFQKLLGGALVAAAAVAAPAQAGIIDFENANPGMVGGGDMIEQAGYTVGFFANVPDGGIGSLVGQFYDGDQSSCDTQSQLCPPNTSGTYYGALDDSYLDIMFTQGPGFQIKSFDAAFIGTSPALGSYPNPVGLVSVIGIRADGSSLRQDFWFDRPGAGNFQLNRFTSDGDFAKTTFVEALVYGFACDTRGDCKAFQTNKGQFAIDNIQLADVPEPATAAIVGLGLLGLGVSRRRRQA